MCPYTLAAMCKGVTGVTTIYVHPTCTGCKKAEEFLKSSGVAYDRRNYFRDTFTEDELSALFQRLGVGPRDVLSRRSRAYQGRRDEIDAMSDEALIAAMVAEPTLIRRPIVVSGDAYVVGSRKADLERFVQSDR